MAICLLCKENEADQTGSHILTAWITASIFDQQGRNRDYELIFKLTTLAQSENFFGRSVLPEKIEEELGRELTDSEKENQKNDLVRDFIFCKICEKKFKVVEDYFKTIHLELDKKLIPENIDANITRLFFYSLLWRASILKFQNFTINEKINESLRIILNNNLEQTLNETIEKANKDKSIRNYPLAIIKTPKPEQTTSNLIFLHPDLSMPYTCFINDYIVLFYERNTHVNSRFRKLFLMDGLVFPYSITNYNETKFYIDFMTGTKWSIIKVKLIDQMVYSMFDNLLFMYKEMFKKKFNTYPTKENEQTFLNCLVSNNRKIGDKYSKEAIVDAMNKSIR